MPVIQFTYVTETAARRAEAAMREAVESAVDILSFP
jgi:hypothetical protein